MSTSQLRLIAACVGVVALGVASTTRTGAASPMSQDEYDRLKMNWAVQNGGTVPEPVRAGTLPQYNLFNLTAEKVIKYKSQRGDAINLGWAERNQSFYVRFAKQDQSDGVITYHEPIAFAVVQGGFVKYQRGRDGINLSWSSTPAYEWSFVGGAAGAPVTVGTVVALCNSVEKDCLFYEPRTNGINLKWVQDKGKYDTLVNIYHAVAPAVDAIRTGARYF
jgi:hypothetical protein